MAGGRIKADSHGSHGRSFHAAAPSLERRSIIGQSRVDQAGNRAQASKISAKLYGIIGRIHYIPTIFDTGPKIVRIEGTTPDQDKNDLNLPDGLCDIVIMNPPFTRPTNHEIAEVPVPSFAGFGKTEEEQKAMSDKIKKINPRIQRKRKGKFGNGNAGLASNFMDLAHAKLRVGGTIAMVLPFSFVTGAGWANARRMLHECYNRIRVISIATSGQHDRAFSADTGMAECLLVATKVAVQVTDQETKRGPTGNAHFSTIRSRPSTFLEASQCSDQIWRENAFDSSILEAGGAGVKDKSVIETAHKLRDGILSLPRIAKETSIHMVPLGEIADRGLLGRDINGRDRGAFDIRAINEGEIPTYPILWSHRCEKERCMVVQPDSCGDIIPGLGEKAMRTWETASELHCTIDFRINSQSLSMCLTPEPCIGGRAWPNVILHNTDHVIPLLLWSNSTLGLMMFWYKGTRQQQGRSVLSLSRHPNLPVLDVRTLTEIQLIKCREIFETIKNRRFLPANEAYRDPARKDLDAALLHMLGISDSFLGGLNLLRKKWCAEPSVHGGKSTRIVINP